MLPIGEKKTRTLKKCIENQSEEMLWILESKEEVCIDESLGSKLREIIGDELVERGLNDNDEPNDYGIELEELIDVIGRMFMKDKEDKGTVLLSWQVPDYRTLGDVPVFAHNS